MRRIFLLLLCAGLLAPDRVSAQAARPGDLSTVVTRADSVRAVRSANAAQRRFELIRRNHLPWTHDPGSGPCDERIGRFCIWYSSGGSTWEPAPEQEPVVRGRYRLIEQLDEAAGLVPGDAWIAGQRVRYLLEAGEEAAAVHAARDCRSPEPGWCTALLGYALHGAGDFRGADSAFAAAVDEMQQRDRERWTDLSAILEPGEIGGYRRLQPEERAAFETRFWWLADPLWMVDGNDRRTEHFVRHVTDRLQDRARSTEGISWGWDLRELLIRYGSPAGWERIRAPVYVLHQDTRIITRYQRGGRLFTPRREFVEAPHEISSDAWDISPRRARSAYAPAYVDSILSVEHQLAVFRRGDSLRIVTALEAPRGADDGEGRFEAGLIFARDEFSPPILTKKYGDGSVVLHLETGDTEGVVSVEALALERRSAARSRYGIGVLPLLPGQVALSDLLVTGGSELDDDLDAVLDRARPRLTFRSREELGLYWEVYGLARRNQEMQIELHLIDRNAGLLRRIATRAGLMSERHPLVVRWREEPDAGPVVARALTVEVPDVEPGRYAIQMTVTLPGRDPLRAEREIEVLDPSPAE
jgi:hypothetical protein